VRPALDAAAVFGWHFRRYLAQAAPQSLLAAAEAESNPRELLRFAEVRFRGLIHGFEVSFFDSWDRIGEPFRQAAIRSARCGPGASP
jgi:hypothetical protein